MIGRYERALFRLIKQWGGKVHAYKTSEEYEAHKNQKFSAAPFTTNDIGTNFRAKALFYSEENPPTWGDIVHEMGHLFATKYGPNNAKCVEPHWVGWEYALVKKIRAPVKQWYEEMGAYTDAHKCEDCNPRRYRTIELGEMSAKCLTLYFKDKVREGVRRNIIVRKKNRLVPMPVR